MIILSKLADYGVIVASHLAADPERQVTAAAVAVETRLPRATVAKLLKALAHGGVVTGARQAGFHRHCRSGYLALGIGGQMRGNDDAIIGQFTEDNHGTQLYRTASVLIRSALNPKRQG